MPTVAAADRPPAPRLGRGHVRQAAGALPAIPPAAHFHAGVRPGRHPDGVRWLTATPCVTGGPPEMRADADRTSERSRFGLCRIGPKPATAAIARARAAPTRSLAIGTPVFPSCLASKTHSRCYLCKRGLHAHICRRSRTDRLRGLPMPPMPKVDLYSAMVEAGRTLTGSPGPRPCRHRSARGPAEPSRRRLQIHHDDLL